MSHDFSVSRSGGRRALVALSGLGLLAGSVISQPALAQTGGLSSGPSNQAAAAFKAVWARTDLPVANSKVQRSWLWGPGPLDTRSEPMAESPGGQRQVQYYDKARMEMNNPAADPNSPWFVTNGLLVVEMLTGRIQTGADKFEQRSPNPMIIAGDQSMMANAVNFTPSYATVAAVASLAPGQNVAQPATGQQASLALWADGSVHPLDIVGQLGKLVAANLPRYQYYEKVTGHNVPDVFWTFMNQSGLTYENGQYRQGPLFNWVYAMGYPVTEPYWIQTYIGTQRSTVLVQAFQRRILTYNPNNPAGWMVEMANVGSQYYQWRYGQLPPVLPSNPPRGAMTNLPMRELVGQGPMASRQYSAIKTPLYAGLSSQADWSALWQRHTAELDMVSSAPQVNFATEFVVAAMWGDKPNGCYRLDIKSVAASGNTITVTVSQVVNQGACTDVITQPNDLQAVSRTGLPAGTYNINFVDTAMSPLSSNAFKLP